MAAKLGFGNCPVCGLAVNTVGKGKTPRHGHIKWGNRWLPPCAGSGKPVRYFQSVKKSESYNRL